MSVLFVVLLLLCSLFVSNSTVLNEERRRLAVDCLPYDVSIRAWYRGDSFDDTLNFWYDLSGNGYHMVDPVGNPSLLSKTFDNGKTWDVVTGGGATPDGLFFDHVGIISSTSTYFFLAKYQDNPTYAGRIPDGHGNNWLIGHWAGRSGVCYQAGWLTQTTSSIHGTEWVLSSATMTTYKSNGIPRTDGISTTGTAVPSRFGVNCNTKGCFTNERSDWEIAEILIYNRILSSTEIENVEVYFNTIYGITSTDIDTNEAVYGNCRTYSPTINPTNNPTPQTLNPSITPTLNPSKSPTLYPTMSPNNDPSVTPTQRPTTTPSETPTQNPSEIPTTNPTENPTETPSVNPTNNPTSNPTENPSEIPTTNPTEIPTNNPSNNPTENPTEIPTLNPSKEPSISPTPSPVVMDSFLYNFNGTFSINSLLSNNYNHLLTNGYNQLSQFIETAFSVSENIYVQILIIDGTKYTLNTRRRRRLLQYQPSFNIDITVWCLTESVCETSLEIASTQASFTSSISNSLNGYYNQNEISFGVVSTDNEINDIYGINDNDDPNNDGKSSNGNSDSNNIYLYVGISIGVIILLLGIGYVMWRQSNKSNQVLNNIRLEMQSQSPLQKINSMSSIDTNIDVKTTEMNDEIDENFQEFLQNNNLIYMGELFARCRLILFDLILIKTNEELTEILEEFGVSKIDRLALFNALDVERIKRSELNKENIINTNTESNKVGESNTDQTDNKNDGNQLVMDLPPIPQIDMNLINVQYMEKQDVGVHNIGPNVGNNNDVGNLGEGNKVNEGYLATGNTEFNMNLEENISQYYDSNSNVTPQLPEMPDQYHY